MNENRSKQTLLLLLGIYIVSSNCRLSNSYSVTGNEVNVHEESMVVPPLDLFPYYQSLFNYYYHNFLHALHTPGPTQVIVDHYPVASILDRVISIQKTQNEYTKYGGTTVYLYDEQGSVIHAHTGGTNKEPYYKIEYTDNQSNTVICLLKEPISAAIDKYVRFVGIMIDKKDLLNAPITKEGPFGCYGNLVNPKKYEQIRAEINQRYAKWQGIATTDLIPPLADAPLWNKFNHTPVDPNCPCIPGKSVSISVAHLMNQ